jgi:outer membrane protein assembly factor BamA
MGRFSVNHRFTEDISGVGYISASSSEFTYAPNVKSDSSSLNNYGFGFTVTKKISEIFSASSGYNYSYIDRSLETYGRHVLNASVTGRF